MEKRGCLAAGYAAPAPHSPPFWKVRRMGWLGYCSGIGCGLGRSLTRIEAERPMGSIGSVLLSVQQGGKIYQIPPPLEPIPRSIFFDVSAPERAQRGSHIVRPSRASGGRWSNAKKKTRAIVKGALMQTMVCVRFGCPERSKGAVTTHDVSPA